MNDLTTTSGNAPQVTMEDLTDEERELVEDGLQGKHVLASGYYILGRSLCRLKERCAHGRFITIVNTFFDVGATVRKDAMLLYRAFRDQQMAAIAAFSDRALIELSRAPDPQAALEEANSRKEAGEAVTAKIAREIAAAQKAQQEAEERARAAEEGKKAVQLQLDQALEAAKPNQDRLIRELKLKRKGGGISEAEANALSLFPEDLQRVQYERLRRGESLELDRQAAERTAAQAVEQQQKAMAETQQAKAEVEEMKRKVDELVREGTQGVIDDLNAKITALEKQVERVRETAWEEGKAAGQKSADEALRQERDELRQQNAALEKEKAAVQRKLTSTEGQVTALASETRVLEARAKGAEEKLEAAHPLAKDNLHAQVLNHMTADLKAELEKLEADCEPHQRRLSDEAIKGLSFVLDGYLQQNLIIEA